MKLNSSANYGAIPGVAQVFQFNVADAIGSMAVLPRIVLYCPRLP